MRPKLLTLLLLSLVRTSAIDEDHQRCLKYYNPNSFLTFSFVNQSLTYRDFFIDPDVQRLPKTRTHIGAMPLGIGSIIDEGSATFTGLIDELKIHAGVLSAEDIQREVNDIGPVNR